MIRVSGHPATFATKGERPWKEALERQIPLSDGTGSERGVIVDFRLGALEPHGQPLDVDNLMEPLLSVLVNRRGWLGRARPSIQWWRATKTQRADQGCDIDILEGSPPADLFVNASAWLLNETYHGDLPRNAKNEVFASWADRQAPRLGRGRGYYHLNLVFGGGFN